MTGIEAVRLKSSDKSTITREKWKSNASDIHIKLQQQNLLATPAPQVRQQGTLLVVGTHYTIDLVNGVVDLVSTPPINDEFEFVYYWSVFNDTEIQYFIDDAGGNVTIATAKLLLAWAADAAKLAKRQTLSGGGGLGQVVVDTSVAAKELRATAKELISTEQDLGESIPSEGLTEVPWNEQVYRRQIDQHFTRKL